jgi:transcriptional regulator with XRE-family HTH domain
MDPESRFGSSHVPDLEEIGRRIRKLRVERQMTLKQVEEACGLSATHLSEIERGRTSPTIGALIRIARSLGKDPAYFMEIDERGDVAHAMRDVPAQDIETGVSALSMTPGIPGGEIHAYRIRLRSSPPSRVTFPDDGSRRDLMCLVTRGRIEGCTNGWSSLLGAGDGLHIAAQRGLTLESQVSGDAEAIVIGTTPFATPARAGAESPRSVVLAADTAPNHADPVDPSPVELGRRIKLLRIARSLTLKELEARGGISATHVSEIERGKASPTVGALARIARALRIRPATLVEPRVLPEVSVMRADERGRVAVRTGNATFEPLSGTVHGATLGAHVLTLPIAREPVLAHQHEGEEWATVLSGIAEIRVENDRFVMREGESLHFRAQRPHAYSNPASSPAVLLIASRPRLAF